jgi:hypothetical protein
MQFPGKQMEAELKRELAHHLHELTAEFERRGRLCYKPEKLKGVNLNCWRSCGSWNRE